MPTPVNVYELVGSVENATTWRDVRRSVFDVAGPRRYWLRAMDSGTGNYVSWGPYQNPSEHLTPNASETTPNFTGTLGEAHVLLGKPI